MKETQEHDEESTTASALLKASESKQGTIPDSCMLEDDPLEASAQPHDSPSMFEARLIQVIGPVGLLARLPYSPTSLCIAGGARKTPLSSLCGRRNCVPVP